MSECLGATQALNGNTLRNFGRAYRDSYFYINPRKEVLVARDAIALHSNKAAVRDDEAE